MNESVLFLLQRVTAAILAPLVVLHLIVILYAVEGGLTAAEILARTRGSTPFAVVYGLFVLAAAIHAPIGLRGILIEWFGLRGRGLEIAMLLLAAILLATGLRAVRAVTGA
ncbi:MAG: succinate dehydrogenase [Geminicoccaceae bacterium]|nr:succinate dehydrogenase [Geminicoccaceae bacterium]MCB9944273.1 succinate dehydrogenase [Geminicoccaceae bacterium]